MVSGLQGAVETGDHESNFGVQGMPEERAKCDILSCPPSELEHRISLRLRSLALELKEIKVHTDSWLQTKEDELAQLERQCTNQATLASVSVSTKCLGLHFLLQLAIVCVHMLVAYTYRKCKCNIVVVFLAIC